MNYTIHQLQLFVEVVKQSSITKAAEEMHMTQPALSIQLRNFQHQFDIPLTEMVGRRLQITDFGKDIARIAESILAEVELLQYKTIEYHNLLTGKLKIAAASTGKYVLPYFLPPFLQQYPDVDLLLDVTNKQKVIESLQQNEIDMALVSVVPKQLDVHEIPLIDNHLYLIGNSVEAPSLQPLIYREIGSATRVAMDKHFGQSKNRKQIELTSNEAVKQAVIAGLGCSVMPLIGLKNELLQKELFIIKAKGLPIKTSWRLIWLRQKKLTPVMKAFISYLEKEKNEIANKNFKWYLDFDATSFFPS